MQRNSLQGAPIAARCQILIGSDTFLVESLDCPNKSSGDALEAARPGFKYSVTSLGCFGPVMFSEPNYPTGVFTEKTEEEGTARKPLY